MQNQDMSSSKDLKMKEAIVDDSGSTWQDGYKEAQRETRLHYRAVLQLFKDRYEAVKARHVEEVAVERLQAKLEILEKAEKVFGPLKEKQRIICELSLAYERMQDVRVPAPDWHKMGESWLFD